MTGDTWHASHDMWHFFDTSASIRTCQEIECLLYAGFFPNKHEIPWFSFLYIHILSYKSQLTNLLKASVDRPAYISLPVITPVCLSRGINIRGDISLIFRVPHDIRLEPINCIVFWPESISFTLKEFTIKESGNKSLLWKVQIILIWQLKGLFCSRCFYKNQLNPCWAKEIYSFVNNTS